MLQFLFQLDQRLLNINFYSNMQCRRLKASFTLCKLTVGIQQFWMQIKTILCCAPSNDNKKQMFGFSSCFFLPRNVLYGSLQPCSVKGTHQMKPWFIWIMVSWTSYIIWRHKLDFIHYNGWVYICWVKAKHINSGILSLYLSNCS